MKIRTEATGPNGRTIAVELDSEDGRNAFGAAWDSWPLNDQFRRLSAKADSLLVFYMAREHLMSPEQAKARITALREAMK